MEVTFYPLLVVLLLAVTVPVIFHRLPWSIPIVVGEIVAGMLVGPHCLGLIGEENESLRFLKMFGFSYLMFLSGLEIDFDLLAKEGRSEGAEGWRRIVGNPVRAGLLGFAAAFLVAALFGWVLVEWGFAKDVFLMALILSTTSLGVVMPVLKERGLTRSPFGQQVLVASVVGDFATVLLVSTYFIVYGSGLKLEVLLVLVLLAATFLVYRLARFSQKHLPLERVIDELSHATAQLDTRGALALALIFIALAQGLGLEVILGAFLAGAILSILGGGEGSQLRTKLDALGYGFFIPIFFVMVGVDFDLPALVNQPGGVKLVLFLIAAAFAVKTLAALVYKPVLPWRETLALGIITSARLSLIIAIAEIGVERGLITESTNAAVVCVSVATVLLAPLLFNRIAPEAAEPARRVIIVGAPPQARLLGQRLRAHGESVAIITSNPRFFQEAEELGLEAILVGEHGHLRGLPDAGIDRAKAVVCMLDNEDDAYWVATAAHRTYGVETVVALVRRPDIADRLRAEGVQVVDPGLAVVVMLEGLLLHPHAFSLISEAQEDREVRVVALTNPRFDGRTVRDLHLPGDALILVVARHGEAIIPRGHTRLRRGDLLTLVGSRDAVEDAVEYLAA